MKVAGIVVCSVGVLLLLLGVAAETTAPYSDTLNIGLMQRQVLLVNSGLAALLGGVMLFGFAAVVEAIRSANQAEAVPPSELSHRDAYLRALVAGGGLFAALLIGLILISSTREQIPTYSPTGELYNTAGTALDEYNVADVVADLERANATGGLSDPGYRGGLVPTEPSEPVINGATNVVVGRGDLDEER